MRKSHTSKKLYLSPVLKKRLQHTNTLIKGQRAQNNQKQHQERPQFNDQFNNFLNKKEKKWCPKAIGKVRFLTQDIEKSKEQLLLVPQVSRDKKKYSRLSSIESNNCDDAYQKGKKVNKDKNEKNNNPQQKKKKSDQYKSLKCEILVLNQVKFRNPIKRKGISTKNRSQKVKQKSPLMRNHKNQQQRKTSPFCRFISPQVLNIENSYCFDSQIMLDKRHETQPNSDDSPSSKLLCPPKRQPVLLFDSNGSIWRSISPKLLRSTVDLLN